MVGSSTVKAHLKNLYGKLGVGDRAAAVAEGMRRGLLR
jgi:ATP/maltotriose-dependent transcriptional regulator MalT